MAVSYGGTSTTVIPAQNPASITPTMPASIAAGNLLILFIGIRNDTATVTTPTGYTLAGSVAGGGGTAGASAGPSRVYAFTRTATATSADTLGAVTLTGASVAFAQVIRLANATGLWLTGASSGSDSTVGTAWSVAGDLDPGLTAGDYAVVATVSGQAAATWSAQAVAATGVSAWGTAVEVNEINSTTGNDINGYISYHPVTSGTSSAAPVITATAAGTTTNTRGVSILIRAREDVVAAPSAAPTVTPGTATHRTAPLSWTAVSGATGYHVERDGTIVATLGNVTSWTDTTLVESTVYAYRVRGFNSGGNGPYSSSQNATTTAAPAWTATNLFPNPRPAAGATGWGNFTGTASVVTNAAGPAGGNALQVAWSTPNGGIGGGVSFGQLNGRVPGTSGTEYRAAIYAKVNRAQRLGLTFEYFGADGTTQVGFSLTTDADLPANTWTHLTHVATAPASTAFVVVTVYSSAGGSGSLWTTGDVLQVQAATVVATSTTVEAFHGGMTDTANRVYDWTGTADASTSTVGAGSAETHTTARTASATATATGTTATDRTKTGTATATATATRTVTSTRTPARTAAATATATGATSSSRTVARTATATATATRSTSSTRVTARTAQATAAASAVSGQSPDKVTARTATATATATASTTTTRAKTGTASATASAARATTTSRPVARTATATATATRTVTTARTTTGTAAATASATRTVTSTRATARTATATATATGSTIGPSPNRTTTGTATATASASRVTTTTRTAARTATATASASRTTTTARLSARTAQATATATRTGTSSRSTARTAQAAATAGATVATVRAVARTATATATAAGTTTQRGPTGDFVITWGSTRTRAGLAATTTRAPPLIAARTTVATLTGSTEVT